MFWLTDVKRENWTDLIINFTNFYQADRIIVPWRPTDRHQSVYHFDSIRQVIEWFDPCLSEPNHFCTETIANFIKVSSNKSGFIFYLQSKHPKFADMNNWKKDFNPSRFKSRQHGGTMTCVVHAIMVIKNLIMNPMAEINYTDQELDRNMRKELCKEILEFHEKC